ncbi:MAG: hypothetical protein EXR39_00365 [Betaproteobacteria bacterium]|nr:hypothetical protein [Betaproteobacteria bacterium]
MKTTITTALAVRAALLVAACVVRPATVRYVESASPQTVDEDEYVPPTEYVVDAPIYYDTMPGITFYPIFIDTPGLAFASSPCAFIGARGWASIIE